MIDNAETNRRNATIEFKEVDPFYLEDDLDLHLIDILGDTDYLYSTMRAFSESILYYGSYDYKEQDTTLSSLETYKAARRAMSSNIQDYRPFARFISQGKEDDQAFAVPTSKFRQTIHLPSEDLFSNYIDLISQTEGDLAFSIWTERHAIAVFRESAKWTLVNNDWIERTTCIERLKCLIDFSMQNSEIMHFDFITISNHHKLNELNECYFDDFEERAILYSAMRFGDNHTTSMLLDKINCVGTSSEKPLAVVLSGKKANGITALAAAMSVGNTETLTAYLNKVIELKETLGDKAFIDLITGKVRNDLSALLLAMRHGNTETLTAYLNRIIALKETLGDEALKDIIIGKDLEGNCALFAAMLSKRENSITAYLNIILTLKGSLRDQVLDELLLARDLSGRPIFPCQEYMKDDRTKIMYLNAIANHEYNVQTAMAIKQIVKNLDSFQTLEAPLLEIHSLNPRASRDVLFTCLQHKVSFSEEFLDRLTKSQNNTIHQSLQTETHIFCQMLKAISKERCLEKDGGTFMRHHPKGCSLFLNDQTSKIMYTSFSRPEQPEYP